MSMVWGRVTPLQRILLFKFYGFGKPLYGHLSHLRAKVHSHSQPPQPIYLFGGYVSCQSRTKCGIDRKWWNPRVELQKKLSEDPWRPPAFKYQATQKRRGFNICKVIKEELRPFRVPLFCKHQAKINKRHSCGTESLLWKLFSCVWLFKMNFHQSFHGFWSTLVWL